jgi:hypothetical protein
MTIGLEKMIVLRQHVYDLLDECKRADFHKHFQYENYPAFPGMSSSENYLGMSSLKIGHVITENYPAFPGMSSLEKVKYFSSSTISCVFLSMKFSPPFWNHFQLSFTVFWCL